MTDSLKNHADAATKEENAKFDRSLEKNDHDPYFEVLKKLDEKYSENPDECKKFIEMTIDNCLPREKVREELRTIVLQQFNDNMFFETRNLIKSRPELFFDGTKPLVQIELEAAEKIREISEDQIDQILADVHGQAKDELKARREKLRQKNLSKKIRENFLDCLPSLETVVHKDVTTMLEREKKCVENKEVPMIISGVDPSIDPPKVIRVFGNDDIAFRYVRMDDMPSELRNIVRCYLDIVDGHYMSSLDDSNKALNQQMLDAIAQFSTSWEKITQLKPNPPAQLTVEELVRVVNDHEFFENGIPGGKEDDED